MRLKLRKKPPLSTEYNPRAYLANLHLGIH